MPDLPRIAVVTRSFGNTRDFEGISVKAGTKFAVAEPIEGLKQLKPERYFQLARVHLVRPLPDNEPAPNPAQRKEAEVAPPARPTVRAAAPRRQMQELDPPAPERLNPQTSAQADAPPGSPTGVGAMSSSSAADLPSSTSSPSSPKRGRRRRNSNG